MKYIDTHCHLAGPYYKDNVIEDIKHAQQEGVNYIIMPGTTAKDSQESIALAKNHPGVFACAGIHPADASDPKALTHLDEVNPSDIIAVGEVGIDLYRDSNPPLALQEKVFRHHIEYALKHDKPIIIHMRACESELYNIIKDYPKARFVMHSFTSTWQWASKFIKLGGYISFSGIVTFKNAKELQEVVKKMPLDRIIYETDAPFLTPTPHRGKHNKPEYVKHVAHQIATLRDEKQEQVLKTLFNNALKLFKIKGGTYE